MFDVPIALIVFNRPALAAAAIARLREQRPSRLLVIADGPRPHVPDDAQLVQATRSVIESIDWPCELTRIYSAENLGCRRRIFSGISEAFDYSDELIVLEDDCVAHPDFFGYCEVMLQRYRDDDRVMAVSGNCFLDTIPDSTSSYYFSKYMHCWGWATWKRAWNKYDASNDLWSRFTQQPHFSQWVNSEHESEYWENEFAKVASGVINTWDYHWQLSCWMNQGLTVLPSVNLVSNVGFGEAATHTKKPNSLSDLPTFSLGDISTSIPVQRNELADRRSDQLVYSGRWRAPTKFKKISRSMRNHVRSFIRRLAA